MYVQNCSEKSFPFSYSSQGKQHQETGERIGIASGAYSSHHRMEQPATARQQKCMQRIAFVAAADCVAAAADATADAAADAAAPAVFHATNVR